MNKWIGSILVAISTQIFCNPKADAAGETVLSTGKIVDHKFYPLPECILINQQGIFINVEGCVYQAPALYADQSGPYVQSNFSISTNWKCTVCGHPNPPWAEKCLTCNQ